MHQIFNIESQKQQCPYCNEKISKNSWDTHFEATKMYKHCSCPKCERTLTIPTNFLGSGHDSWDKTENWKKSTFISEPKSGRSMSDLESRIKIVKEYKMHP